jgi:type IV pilus assembly protein PilW
LTTPDFTFTLAPVQIIKGAGGSPDQILVTYGNSSYFVTSRKFKPPSTTTSKILVRRDAFNNGDIVLLTDMGVDAATGRCGLVEITNNTNPDGSFDHVQGAVYAHFPDGINRTASMNAAPGGATLVVASVGDPGYAYNLGPDPRRNLWQVTPAGAANSNMLVWRNTLRSDTAQPVTDGIVNLQAEYGVDDGAAGVGGAIAGDGIISPSEWTINQPTDWKQLLAVRFALLARGQQYEKDVVTSNAPVWDNGARTFTMFNVDGTDWRHYRYRVYEAIVPLRNMLWGAAP